MTFQMSLLKVWMAINSLESALDNKWLDERNPHKQFKVTLTAHLSDKFDSHVAEKLLVPLNPLYLQNLIMSSY